MEYWTISEGVADRIYTCRQCKTVIPKGSQISVRDGRKIRLIYHSHCFSGKSDPRTQTASSFHEERYQGAVSAEAPTSKGYGKWSTSSYGYQGTLTSKSTSKSVK